MTWSWSREDARMIYRSTTATSVVMVQGLPQGVIPYQALCPDGHRQKPNVPRSRNSWQWDSPTEPQISCAHAVHQCVLSTNVFGPYFCSVYGTEVEAPGTLSWLQKLYLQSALGGLSNTQVLGCREAHLDLLTVGASRRANIMVPYS